MVHHIRRFVHGQGCVQIVLKELDSPVPGYQHTILTYSWCRLCKQVRMWASESLLFWFSILVVTGFVWKGSMFEKVLFSGAMAKLAENLLLIQMFSRYLQIPLVALGLLRVKNLVWGSLVRKCQKWLSEDRSKQKKWSCPLRGEEYGLLLAMNHYEHQKNVCMGKGSHQDLLG